MKLLTLFQSVIAIIVTAWLFYQLGNFLNPAHSLNIALMGGVIAMFATILVSLKFHENEELWILIGAIINSLAILAIGIFLADNPWLWLGLSIVNFPLYFYIADKIFDSKGDFLFSLSNTISGEFEIPTREERKAGLKGLIFFVLCVSIVAVEYKIIAYLFIENSTK